MTRDEAIAYIREWMKDEYALDWKDREALGMAIKALEERPTGEWIWHEDEEVCNCSKCDFEIDATGCIDPNAYVEIFNFCPNCGSDMRGEQDGRCN